MQLDNTLADPEIPDRETFTRSTQVISSIDNLDRLANDRAESKSWKGKVSSALAIDRNIGDFCGYSGRGFRARFSS